MKRLVLLAVLSLSLAGCHARVSQTELDDIVSKSQNNTEPGELVLQRSDRKDDYYRVRSGSRTIGRYKVRRTVDY